MAFRMQIWLSLQHTVLGHAVMSHLLMVSFLEMLKTFGVI